VLSVKMLQEGEAQKYNWAVSFLDLLCASLLQAGAQFFSSLVPLLGQG